MFWCDIAISNVFLCIELYKESKECQVFEVNQKQYVDINGTAHRQHVQWTGNGIEKKKL